MKGGEVRVCIRRYVSSLPAFYEQPGKAPVRPKKPPPKMHPAYFKEIKWKLEVSERDMRHPVLSAVILVCISLAFVGTAYPDSSALLLISYYSPTVPCAVCL